MGGVRGIRRPTSATTETETYDYEYIWSCNAVECWIARANLVYQATSAEGTWNYSHQTAGPYYYLSESTGPNGKKMQVLYAQQYGRLQWIKRPDRTYFHFYNDWPNRLSRMRHPEGNETRYSYDNRGNLIEVRSVPKPGSQLADIVETAGFDATCTNPRTCNQPNWRMDGRGNRTDYAYHEPSGFIASVTEPADENGIRPQTRYAYQQRYAYIRNSAGNLVPASDPIWVLTSESFCRTSAATANGCSVAGDEVVKTYEYASPGEPNNLLVRGVVVTADGESLRTCYSYDARGNLISETAPKAGLTSCP